jgi:DNA replication protein DnaC
MHIEETIRQMREMKLSHMVTSLELKMQNNETKDLTPEELLSLLIEDEYTMRKERKLNRMISNAGFKVGHACMENLKYSAARGLDKKQITPYKQESWIKNAHTLVITGPTGTGKTFLAEAIGLRACQMGYSSLLLRYTKLFDEISEARGLGTYVKYLEKLNKNKVLILDDFAIRSTTASEASTLLDILDSRDHRGSVIITSQYPASKWHSRFQDPTIADAILDRLVQGASRINLKGGSMRRNK